MPKSRSGIVRLGELPVPNEVLVRRKYDRRQFELLSKGGMHVVAFTVRPSIYGLARARVELVKARQSPLDLLLILVPGRAQLPDRLERWLMDEGVVVWDVPEGPTVVFAERYTAGLEGRRAKGLEHLRRFFAR